MLNASNVRQAIAGAVYYDGTRLAAAPTGTASAVTDYDNLGYVSEDGVTLTMPGSGDATAIKAWQNGATVRTIRTPSEDQPELSLTLLETKVEVIEAVFGVTVERGVTEGSFVINTNATRDHARLIFDVIDGDERIRIYAPKAIVTEVGEMAFTNGDPIGYEVTIACEYDDGLKGQAKVWSTALRTVAPVARVG